MLWFSITTDLATDPQRPEHHTYSVCVVVKDHQVAVADVKARQMVTGVLGIKYVFIDHVGRPSCFWCVPPEKQPDMLKDRNRQNCTFSTRVLY